MNYELQMAPFLTTKESEVLHLISYGFGIDEIVIRLRLNNKQVKLYQESLKQKFNAVDLSQLVQLAYKRGSISRYPFQGLLHGGEIRPGEGLDLFDGD